MELPLIGTENTALRNAREKLGLSQEELGFRAGISAQSLRQIEKNATNPTLLTAMRLCKALGVLSLDELFSPSDWNLITLPQNDIRQCM